VSGGGGDLTRADCLRILGLPPKFSHADIKKAFRSLVLRTHPDSLGPVSTQDKIEASRLMEEGLRAYRSLIGEVELPAGGGGGKVRLKPASELAGAAKPAVRRPRIIDSGRLVKGVFPPVKAKIWAMGGGKGGVGKSLMSANLGAGLAGLGYRVILVDADLGGANLHTCLGIKSPERTLSDYLQRKVESLDEVCLETPVDNLRLISGASEMLGLANPYYAQKQRLINHINQLQADYILLDLGAGTSYNVLDFFSISGEGIVMVSPEPTSLENAYGFIKRALFRQLFRRLRGNQPVLDFLKLSLNPAPGGKPPTVTQIGLQLLSLDPEAEAVFQTTLARFRPRLVVNMVNTRSEVEVGTRIVDICSYYLDIDLDYLGFVYTDVKVLEAVRRRVPFVTEYPRCIASLCLHDIITRLLDYDRKRGKASDADRQVGE
jgi:flagellar biosynthesis protein FlhG